MIISNKLYGNVCLLVLGRLVVGWSWQEFVTACFGAMIGDFATQSVGGVWVGAIVKVVVAGIVSVGGAYFELWRLKKVAIEKENRRKSSEEYTVGQDENTKRRYYKGATNPVHQSTSISHSSSKAINSSNPIPSTSSTSSAEAAYVRILPDDKIAKL